MAFSFNNKNDINKLYELNKQGDITITNLVQFQNILEKNFEEAGMDIKFDNIIAEKQI